MHSMKAFELTVEPRTEKGKKVKRIRSEGLVPVIIYGLHTEPQVGQVQDIAFEKLYRKAGESSIVNVSLGADATIPTIIHSVDRHPVTDRIIHADLMRVDLAKEIEATVLLKHVGAAPAVKEFGAVVVTMRDSVRVRCLPKDLVHEIEVDLSGLAKIGDTVHVRDLKVPAGVTVADDPAAMIISIAAPRAEEEEKKPAAEEAAVPAEGEAAAEGAVASEGAATPAGKEGEAAPEKGKGGEAKQQAAKEGPKK